MPKKGHSEEQIIAALKQHEAGRAVRGPSGGIGLLIAAQFAEGGQSGDRNEWSRKPGPILNTN